MARSRNIKPGFFTNDDLAEIPCIGRLLFIGLWTLADREGRLEDRPRRIKAEILPYDDSDPEELLSQLAEKGFLLRYSVDDKPYIQIVNFTKHQNPHIKEGPSNIPAPDGTAPDSHGTSTVQEQCEHEESPADSGFLIPDSLNLIPDSGSRAGKPPTKRRRQLDVESLPEAWEAHCRQKHPARNPADEFEKFADYHRAKGTLGLDWLASWRTWLRKADEFAGRNGFHLPRSPPRPSASTQLQQNVIGAISPRAPRTIDVDATEVFSPRIAR